MRDLIACLGIWLGEPLRRASGTAYRRARGWFAAPPPPAPATPVLPPAPAYARRPLPDHVQARRAPLDGHAHALVRPYVVTREQGRAAELVRRVQRERRTAAVLATAGIDYDPALAAAQ